MLRKQRQEVWGKKILLTIDGAAHDAEVYWNGKKVGEHRCGYTAFTMDVSGEVLWEEENILTVRVDSREKPKIPPFGFVVDYMTYGGLTREVWIEARNEIYIEDAFVRGEREKDGWEVVSQIAVSRAIGQATLRQKIGRASCRERVF